MLQVLNEVTIKSRLTLALQAYIDTSRAPIAALENLAGTRIRTAPTALTPTYPCQYSQEANNSQVVKRPARIKSQQRSTPLAA